MEPLAHLLIVEDEVALAKNLCRGLSEAGYMVEHKTSAEDAWQALSSDRYDLLLLDLRLPGQDGLEFLRDLRDQGSVLPVLILTARDSTEEMVTGLDTGADDYVRKPFVFKELLARVNALLRRPLARENHFIAAGPIAIDTAGRRAWRNRRELGLSPKELVLLEYLTRHAGTVVTRDAIGKAVWGDDYNASSNIVDVFVNRLRQKIDLIGTPSLIATARGIGYMMRVQPADPARRGPK